MVAHDVNAILAPMFKGRIRVEHVGHLGLGGVGDTDVTIDDPAGHAVLVVRGVSVRVDTWTAVKSAILGGKKPLVVRLTDVEVASLHVDLDSDSDGRLRVQAAFAPAKPSAPPDPNARGLELIVSRIAVAHASALGPGAAPLVVDLDDLHGAFALDPLAMEADVSTARVVARRIVNGADVGGTLEAHVRLPSTSRGIAGRVHWEGTVGAIAHTIIASLEDDRIDASVDVPDADPRDVRTVWADSPMDRHASFHAEAHGVMSRMDVQIGTRLGGAALDARGKLFLSDDKRLEMAVSARGLDVREMVAGAPRTRIDMTGEIAADLKNDGELTGNVSIPFLGGEVAGALIPSTALRATALRTATNRVSGDADIVVREPGAPANVHVRAIPKGDSFALDFGLHAASPDLSRVPALRGEARGRLALSADGSFDVQTKAIAARLHATASDLVKGAAQLRSASADVRVSGLATAARLDGDVHVRGAEIGGLRLVSADMRSKSTMTESHVEISTRGPDTPDLDASADVRVADGLRLDQTRAVLARAGERATVTASRITADGGHLRIDGATIHGLGAPVTADVGLAAQRVRVKASTGGGFLDLARVARLAHVETILKGGGAALDADFAVHRNDASGRAKLDVTGAAIGNARGVSAHLDAKLAGHSLSGQVQARADGVGSIDLEFPRVDLSGSAGLSGESWRRVVGSAAVDARVDLARLAAIVPASQYPLSESRGQVSVKGSFSRQDAAAVAPNADLSVTTSGLAIAPREAPSTDYDGVTVMSQPWHLEGIDFDIAANVDGPRGSIRVSTTARDAKGTIAQLDASATHVPLEDLFAHTTGLATYFRSTPFDIRVQVPERKLGELPPLLRRGGFESGVIRGDVRARGTLLSPEMDASISLRRSHLGSSSLTEPLDSELTAHYDGQRARLLVQAASGGRELARADVHADFAAARLVAGAAPEWDASGRAHFAEFPLQAVALLDDKQVGGTVTGDIDLEGLHEDARLQAALDVAGLRIGRLAYRSARLNAKADGRTADATIRVDQEDGFFEAKAHAIASWGSRLAPALDSAQPLGLNLLAKNFRIAGLQPLVDGTLDEIDGRVDADTRIEIDPAARVPHFVGQVELSQGKVEAVAGGGELHDIAATVKFAPNGVVTLDRLSAAGVSGRLEANASAQLNGLTLESAKGVILIPKSSPMPLSAGGAEIGDVDGRVEITATTTPKGSMDVKVEVPHLRVAVPEASPNGVQALGPIDNVRIGVHRGTPARFVLLPLDPTKPERHSSGSSTAIGIETDLRDVEVVRGTQVKVDLDGQLKITPDQATEVRGQIHIKQGGTLDVEGRTFVVESGTVTFVGEDTSNPQVVVKAGWTAPDGTIVYANFVGPLKTGKVRLTSAPTLSQQEIVQLLLFGTTSGKQAQAPAASTEMNAIGTVGEQAAQPLNHVLKQLGLGSVTANVDTTQSTNPKPEIEIQIARDISIQIAVVLGTPLPGVNPDHTLLTFDWRFLSNWSLASTLGDAGTAIFDLLWQRTY
jgi:translocation and assembly module TamB